MRTNKKAALEMSIGTIVIIVIAITMLILGIVFVRSIMCAGIQMSEELNRGVRDKIVDLFGADKYGVQCMGEGGQEVVLASGGRRPVVCIIRTEEQTRYKLTIDIESRKGTSTAAVKEWIIDQDWTGDVSPGGEGTDAVIALLDIPREVSTTTLKITIKAKNLNTETEKTHISYIDIVPLGFFKGAIC